MQPFHGAPGVGKSSIAQCDLIDRLALCLARMVSQVNDRADQYILEAIAEDGEKLIVEYMVKKNS